MDWPYGPGFQTQELIEQLANDIMDKSTDLIDDTYDDKSVASTGNFPLTRFDQASRENRLSQLDGLNDE